MSHVRQRIRDQIVADLKAADIPGVNARVYASNFFPIRTLPSISVYPEDEAIRVGAMGGELDREVHIVIQILAAGAEGVEDDVDTFCAGVEAAIDPRCGGLTYDGRLFEVRFEKGPTEEGGSEKMSASLVYAFKYMTAAGNPEATSH